MSQPNWRQQGQLLGVSSAPRRPLPDGVVAQVDHRLHQPAILRARLPTRRRSLVHLQQVIGSGLCGQRTKGKPVPEVVRRSARRADGPRVHGLPHLVRCGASPPPRSARTPATGHPPRASIDQVRGVSSNWLSWNWRNDRLTAICRVTGRARLNTMSRRAQAITNVTQRHDQAALFGQDKLIRGRSSRPGIRRQHTSASRPRMPPLQAQAWLVVQLQLVTTQGTAQLPPSRSATAARAAMDALVVQVMASPGGLGLLHWRYAHAISRGSALAGLRAWAFQAAAEQQALAVQPVGLGQTSVMRSATRSALRVAAVVDEQGELVTAQARQRVTGLQLALRRRPPGSGGRQPGSRGRR